MKIRGQLPMAYYQFNPSNSNRVQRHSDAPQSFEPGIHSSWMTVVESGAHYLRRIWESLSAFGDCLGMIPFIDRARHVHASTSHVNNSEL